LDIVKFSHYRVGVKLVRQNLVQDVDHFQSLLFANPAVNSKKIIASADRRAARSCAFGLPCLCRLSQAGHGNQQGQDQAISTHDLRFPPASRA
jgi:hypothetical protein